MTRWYWEQTKGTLVEEFCAVSESSGNGKRLLDGIIIKGEEFRIAQQSEISIKDKDILIVQTKRSRLGMSVMGQALFSAKLMEKFEPRSIESVALVTGDDEVLRPIFEKYPGMKVVIVPKEIYS